MRAELDEDVRRGVDGDTAGQGQVALAGAQRLQGHVQCHQRRRARRVHRDRGALQTQRVGHPPRGDTRGLPGKPEAFDGLRCSVYAHAVTLGVHPGEHAGGAAPQRCRAQSPHAPRLPRTAPATSAAAGPSPAPRWARCRRTPGRSPRPRPQSRRCGCSRYPATSGSGLYSPARFQPRSIGELGRARRGPRPAFPTGRRATRSRPDSDTTFRRSRSVVAGDAHRGCLLDLLRDSRELGADVAGEAVGRRVVEDERG